MEVKWLALSTIAPLAWGANNVVTRELLPVEDPLWGSAIRALPAGLILLAIARELPRGRWWWRAAVLSVFNIGAFFLLVYLAAHLLPASVASSMMALTPLALAGFGWAMLSERPSGRMMIGAVAGIAGVLLLIGGADGGLDVRGICASLGAVTLSSLGATLSKRWADGTPLLASTAWQVTLGGLMLTIVAAIAEGTPHAPDGKAVLGFAFSILIATSLAYVFWFGSIKHLPVGIVGVVGLLNPLSGVALGTLVAGESLSMVQLLGIVLSLAGVGVAVSSGSATVAPAEAPDAEGAGEELCAR
ncbi:EamA family transporter [Nocardioides sp.]|uniref:DMT family transporter n=1 Tax=Nocardioides sp. TaxID=35761 RepID=UPI00262F897F|nr:EamA family transporter [Nocardioides sp.]